MALVVFCFLFCGVVAKGLVQMGTLVVLVVVVLATVVLKALVDRVKLGPGLPSSSGVSTGGPVGPQSINPAGVVVQPSGALSGLSHMSCLLIRGNNLTLSRLPPRDNATAAAANGTVESAA